MKKTLLYIIIASAAMMSVPEAQAQTIDSAPCDASATEAATSLYSYLRNQIWGKKTLSGCQALWDYNITDAESINTAAGKYPAVNVFDFQHVGNLWIDYKTDIAKNWFSNKGIVAFMWHIHAPANAFTEAKTDWAGFYTSTSESKYSHFSPLRSSTEGTLENRVFKKMLNAVAECLLVYQSEGIPVIWRPLHEAAGNTNSGGTAWFWWGSEGATAFKQLYVYMYKYFQTKGIHNLIYVWTSQVNDADWYPGDEYVDIIARDNYSNNTSHASLVSDFTTLKNRYPNKMIALTECDGIPSAANMQNDGAMWLYVAPWTSDYTFGYGNDSSFWKTFLNSDNIISRDEVNY